MAAPAAILFDLGGVLLPFTQARRIAALVRRFGCPEETATRFMADDIHWRISDGRADSQALAGRFADTFGCPVDASEAEDLLLTVFETPNHELWDLAARLRTRAIVGGFSDNPRFVDRLFPPGAFLEPMFFSSELRVFKPEPEAFTAVEAALGLPVETILFIDDTAANVEAAKARGWDAIHFTGNAALLAELAARGLP